MSTPTVTPTRRDAIAARITAATAPDRERFIDLLRALAIGVVVFGHWLLAIVTWEPGTLDGRNALQALPATQWLTWLLQVMPLFFFVGGFSNLTSWRSVRRRRGGYAEFVRSRFGRLLRPTAVFAAAWVVAAFVMEQAGVPADKVHAMAALVAKPLWFMGVYLLLVLAAPAMLALHARFRLLVPVALVCGAIAVDVAHRALEIPYLGMLNFVFVWLMPHQLGFFYADGTLTRLRTRAHATIAAGGLLGMVALTASGLYPVSMVGVPGATSSNNDPPSVALIALSAWLIGLAMMMRQRANAWLQRPRVWATVVKVNAVIMTAFLWHQTALIVGALLLYPLGFPQPEAGSVAWWALRPAWVAVLTVLLAGYVRGFGHVEARTPKPSGRAGPPAVAGALAAAVGVIGFAQAGFAPGSRGSEIPVGPALSAVALGTGLLMMRARAAAAR